MPAMVEASDKWLSNAPFRLKTRDGLEISSVITFCHVATRPVSACRPFCISTVVHGVRADNSEAGLRIFRGAAASLTGYAVVVAELSHDAWSGRQGFYSGFGTWVVRWLTTMRTPSNGVLSKALLMLIEFASPGAVMAVLPR